MNMRKIAVVGLGGFGAAALGQIAQKHESSNSNGVPKYFFYDTSSGTDSDCAVNKTVIGNGNGAGKVCSVARELAAIELKPILDRDLGAFDMIIYVGMLGGGTGSGFMQYIAEWHVSNNKPLIMVAGFNHGSNTELTNVEEATKRIHTTFANAKRSVPMAIIVDDGSHSMETNNQASMIVLALLTLFQSNIRKLDWNDLMSWMRNSHVPKGIAQLSIFQEFELASALPSVVYLLPENLASVTFDNAYRATGYSSAMEVPCIYGLHSAAGIKSWITEARNMLKDSIGRIMDSGHTDDVLSDLF